MPDSNTVDLVANPEPLGTVPAPATGAPRNSASIRAMAQKLLNMIAGAVQVASPTGMVAAIAGNAAPSGWLLCNGQAVSRTTYAPLYAVLGTMYGAGDGSTTFNLPDLRGRVLLGAGQGVGLTNRALGATGGAEAHALSIPELPAHNHRDPTANNPAVPNGGLYELPTLYSERAYPDFDYVYAAPTSSTGGNQAHNNMQPFTVLNYIIRT